MSVEIRVLGDFGLVVEGEPVSVPAQKTKALLAWLACHPGQAQPRDRLAGLLWADRSASNAKASLRQSIAGLRKLLPEGSLSSKGEYLSLDPHYVICDIAKFRAWRKCESLPSLRETLACYLGDLLDGFNPRSNVFEDWLLLERETLRQDALTGFSQLLDMELRQDNSTLAIAAAGTLLALDPLQETVHRSLMQLYANAGQLGSARRQFNLCCEVMRRELDAPPSPETLALFDSLRFVAHKESIPSVTVATQAEAVDRRAALPSIVVLPFRSVSSVSDHQYLADGMTEELISLLANSANWRVASRSLSFQYRDKQTDVRTVGSELGVAYAVEGSIRSMGERVRISAALISTADGTQIWSDRYDRPIAELFDIQDEVVHAIFRTLKNRLGFAERERVRRTPKTNLDAWGLVIKAMQVNVVDSQTHLEQLELVREALVIEPNYPRAHAYLAMILFTGVGRGASRQPKEDALTASEHAEAALSAGASDPVVLKMCAGGLAAVGQAQRSLKLAEQAFEITGAADPLWVAVLMWNGRLEESYAYCDQLVSSMPSNIPFPPGELRPVALLGNLKMLLGDLSGALEAALRDQRANPGNFFPHVNLANVYGLLDRPEEARDAWQLAKAMLPQLTISSFASGYRNVFLQPELAAKFSEGLLAVGLD
ncbi:MAG: BTAD domain-containing putative transcriptional regulator [Halioglobus sp.]